MSQPAELRRRYQPDERVVIQCDERFVLHGPKLLNTEGGYGMNYTKPGFFPTKQDFGVFHWFLKGARVIKPVWYKKRHCWYNMGKHPFLAGIALCLQFNHS